MNFYTSVFTDAQILKISRYKENDKETTGSIKRGIFSINKKRILCSDTSLEHNWKFTPAMSLYIECGSKEEIIELFTQLSKNGEIFMPLDNYGFSRQFGWVADKFGVSWQLNLTD